MLEPPRSLKSPRPHVLAILTLQQLSILTWCTCCYASWQPCILLIGVAGFSQEAVPHKVATQYTYTLGSLSGEFKQWRKRGLLTAIITKA